MRIKYHREFVKNYRKRIAPNPKLVSQFKKQLQKFIDNPDDPILKDHKLIGKKNEYRAFSITGDTRVVYKRVAGEIWLYNIGSHNQVY